MSATPETTEQFSKNKRTAFCIEGAHPVRREDHEIARLADLYRTLAVLLEDLDRD